MAARTSKAGSNPSSLSHTRGVPLEDLTALCLILADQGSRFSVMELANAGIMRDVFRRRTETPPSLVPRGSRLPTRMNHRMIALREMELVESHPSGGQVFYSLTQLGEDFASAVPAEYTGQGAIRADAALRDIWRQGLAASHYVRNLWLKYFTDVEDFDLGELMAAHESITLRHLPPDEREAVHGGQMSDSGYRISSPHWTEKNLDDIERREIYQGLRLWTDNAYLTDYRLPVDMENPFLYQTDSSISSRLTLEYHVVSAYLNPLTDVEFFNQEVRENLSLRGVRRTTVPDLIIQMGRTCGYSKRNLREMLTALYYKTNDYFFERGSEFLISRAFEDVNSEDFYVQIEGVWRTGIMLR